MLKVTAAMLLLGSTVAYAQAPGEYNPTPAPTYAQPPAPYEVPAPVREVNPLRKRFSVSLNVGGMGVSPAQNGYDSYDSTTFNVSELAFRYRLSNRIGVELSFNGGREMLANGLDGDLAMGGGTAALQYHFRPDHAFNWYLLGGLGATVIASRTASTYERDHATRGHGMLGAGTEVRLSPHWALEGELRFLSIGTAMSTDQSTPAYPTMQGTSTPTVPKAGRLSPDEGYGATQFTVGASFYF